jgi:hypothetical protein
VGVVLCKQYIRIYKRVRATTAGPNSEEWFLCPVRRAATYLSSRLFCLYRYDLFVKYLTIYIISIISILCVFCLRPSSVPPICVAAPPAVHHFAALLDPPIRETVRVHAVGQAVVVVVNAVVALAASFGARRAAMVRVTSPLASTAA